MLELKDTGTIEMVDSSPADNKFIKEPYTKVTFKFDQWGSITLKYKGDFSKLAHYVANHKKIELTIKEL